MEYQPGTWVLGEDESCAGAGGAVGTQNGNTRWSLRLLHDPISTLATAVDSNDRRYGVVEVSWSGVAKTF